ncbi:Adenylate and Guanylate cyclase catalytic domain [Trypanosoma vivax]|nr:Adenylate and Guanylate cyclase catalytic domain [Trypanosoma vivax]
MPLHTFVGVFFAFILVMAFVGVLIYAQFFRRDARDNRNAPKALSVPVTLVFTDIESSTAQWAANPQLMPDAIATHHRLIRSLIARHRCYEVKTIGDSFMIACKSALAAVELVRDLQRQFLEHDWGTAALDESYRRSRRSVRRRMRSTCRRLRAWSRRCTGVCGTGCACVRACTPGCATFATTR